MAVLAALGIGALGGAYYYFIVLNPGEEISRERIQRIFTLESPVYYDDGQTVIGVFFQEEHRSYIPYDRIPKSFVHALLAAEDKDFFSHPGVDPAGILRALVLNLRAGRVVQGGSTITQQTAKNLFKREKRSFKAKIVELTHALKLEAHYSKEQILEWYSNQFFVSGNGVGLGIAAQYFFNKPADKLTLMESAFLAGCVKAPNRYNPFIHKGDQARKQALAKARDRTEYVLKNMLALGFIDQKEFDQTVREEIPFNQGRIRYAMNSALDAVRDRLERPDVQEALEDAGVDNIATSGVRIVTSIRKDLQEVAQQVTRENLSLLETRLTGYRRDVVLERYRRVMAAEDEVDRKGFAFGTVRAVRAQKDGPEIDVELPGGEMGRVDREGIQRILAALLQGARGTWATPKKGDESLILKEIQVGDPVFVQMRGRDKEGRSLLTLHQYPEVNGGVLVLQDGFIRSMVSGFDGIHFNRALDAKRQVGSVFKPLIYMAALQLNWGNMDPLRNRWQAFLHHGRLYIPHPDHQSPHEWVSMAWAGAKSENIATVWLLYHLCDRLNPSQLKELARTLDLAPRAGESRARYAQRVRDEIKVHISRDSLLHAAFEETREDLRTDLIFGGRTEELTALDDLHYGLGVERYLKEEMKEASRESRFRDQELRALHHNFLRLRTLQDEMRNDYEVLRWAVTQPDAGQRVGLALPGKGRFFFQYRPEGERIVYTQSPGGRSLVALDLQWVISQLQMGRSLDQVVPLPRVWVDGALPTALLDQLQEGINRRLTTLREHDPYDLDVLCRVRDFKLTMALRYVVRLAKRMGVDSSLDPVLSLPLGANAITMEDVSRMYYALVTGSIVQPENQPEERSWSFLIQRIEGPDGEVLYEARPQVKRVIDPHLAQSSAEILRKVISNGTGHQADNALILSGSRHEAILKKLNLKVPALGKTGTADEYRNSSFVGFLPGAHPGSSSLTLDNGVVIAVYVGYDDNRPMKNTHVRVYGAAGALPIWIPVAQSALRHLNLEERLDILDFTFRPGGALAIEWSPEMREVPVDSGSGLPQAGGAGVRVRTYGDMVGERFEPRRLFSPAILSEKGK
jgi:membrane peptidoglycan carboxypeptidase